MEGDITIRIGLACLDLLYVKDVHGVAEAVMGQANFVVLVPAGWVIFRLCASQGGASRTALCVFFTKGLAVKWRIRAADHTLTSGASFIHYSCCIPQ